MGNGKVIPGLLHTSSQHARFIDETTSTGHLLQVSTGDSAVPLEVLVTQAPYHPVWVTGTPGVIPQGAVVGGQLPDGQNLYVAEGKKYLSGTLYMIPGYYKVADNCAHFEHEDMNCATDYKMLVLERGK